MVPLANRSPDPQNGIPIGSAVSAHLAVVTNRHTDTHWVNSALHPSGVAESSTSSGWGKGENVTSA